MVMAPDASGPSLDISAGLRIDSTNTVVIKNVAWVKSTGGAWSAGNGTAFGGMGAGLTATANTWYHVFAIINAGVADVYFDTSISAANAPSSTTAFARIGSILLNASKNITPFMQYGNKVWWQAPTQQLTAQATSTAGYYAMNVPPGLTVEALLNIAFTGTSAAQLVAYPGLTTTPPTAGSPAGYGVAYINTGSQFNWAQCIIPTDTSQKIGLVSTAGAGGNAYVVTQGWAETVASIAGPAGPTGPTSDSVATGASGSFSGPGTFKIKWGTVATTLSGVAVVFPTAFANACVGVVLSCNTGDITGAYAGASAISTTGFTATSATATSETFFWMATGY
jgi:hypothetical protein